MLQELWKRIQSSWKSARLFFFFFKSLHSKTRYSRAGISPARFSFVLKSGNPGKFFFFYFQISERIFSVWKKKLLFLFWSFLIRVDSPVSKKKKKATNALKSVPLCEMHTHLNENFLSLSDSISKKKTKKRKNSVSKFSLTTRYHAHQLLIFTTVLILFYLQTNEQLVEVNKQNTSSRSRKRQF